MHLTGCLRTFVAVVVLAPLPAGGQSSANVPTTRTISAPLPDLAAFLREVRRRIRLDSDAQSGYTCVERETEVRLDGDGHQTAMSTRTYEIYPPAAGVGPYRRLVSRDGVAVPASELADNDRKRQAEIQGRARDREREIPADRDKRLRREAADRREREALVDEVFRVFDLRMLGRETVAGRPAIVLAFVARPGVAAKSRVGALLQKTAGKVWVDEQDFEPVHLEAAATDDLTYGFGMFARVYKGTTVVWERQKVNGETWMPVRLEIRANARVLLFRRLGLHRVIDYFNYRRATSSSASASLVR